jgi:serine/threonine-protein kinase HipA
VTDLSLTVALEGASIGTLTLREGQPEISYSADYRQNRSATTLSVSMPRTDALHHGQIPHDWLWGLLPDNEDVLRRWATDYDASISSPVSFLATEIGLDCAGAVQFYHSDHGGPSDRDSTVLWINEREVEDRLADLRSDATSWLGQRTTGQFCLAGAQSKTALRWDAVSERWGVPRGDEPSTHILKPAAPTYDDQHINEHLCLLAARNLGLVAAKTEIASFGKEETLVVERFDRVKDTSGKWLRIHQEDLCQALGLHPAMKYERDGGPSVSAIAGATGRATGPTVAQREIQRFVDALIFNWIIGGTDAHAKNYGLLHREAQTRLAPLYDISSFLPYDDSRGHKIKLAMKIGGEYKIKRIGSKQWERLANDLNLDNKQLIERCEELATATPAAFEAAADAFGAKRHTSSMPDQLTSLVTDAARARLDSLANGNLAVRPAPAKYALVLSDPIPFDDLPHSHTLSVRMQLLVEPPGEDNYFYYQFMVARWPKSDLETDPHYGEHDYWDRVGSTAANAAREWLTAGQPGRTSNIIDAVVLRMTELSPGLDTPTSDMTFQEDKVILEWVDAADLIKRPDRELKPMRIASPD